MNDFESHFSANKKPRFGLRSGVSDALNHVLTSWFENEKTNHDGNNDVIRKA